LSVTLKPLTLLQQYKENTEEAEIVPEGYSIYRDIGHTLFYFSSEQKDNRIRTWFFGILFFF